MQVCNFVLKNIKYHSCPIWTASYDEKHRWRFEFDIMSFPRRRESIVGVIIGIGYPLSRV